MYPAPMPRRYTNRSVKWKGETVVFTVRVMKPIAEFVDSQIGQPDLHSRSDVMQDALALWCMEREHEEEQNAHANG